MKQRRFDIFLSYSRHDRIWVGRLKNSLERHNLKVWFDATEVNPGRRHVGDIERALSDTNWFGLVVTPEALRSNWVRQEYEAAVHLSFSETHPTSSNLQLIPILLRKADLPAFLATRTLVDFTDEDQFETALESLVKAIGGPAATGQAPAFTILYVDDLDPEILRKVGIKSIDAELEAFGAKVVTFRTGTEAIQLLRREGNRTKFHLIAADWELTGDTYSGVQVLEEAKRLGFTAQRLLFSAQKLVPPEITVHPAVDSWKLKSQVVATVLELMRSRSPE